MIRKLLLIFTLFLTAAVSATTSLKNTKVIKFSNVSPDNGQIYQTQKICVNGTTNDGQYSLAFNTSVNATDFYLTHGNGKKIAVNLYWNGHLVNANQRYSYRDAQVNKTICGDLKVVVQLNQRMTAGDYRLNVKLNKTI